MCEIVQVELQGMREREKKIYFPADTGFLGDRVLATATTFRDTIKGKQHKMSIILSSVLASIFNFFKKYFTFLSEEKWAHNLHGDMKFLQHSYTDHIYIFY